jgi:hypothetical protein
MSTLHMWNVEDDLNEREVQSPLDVSTGRPQLRVYDNGGEHHVMAIGMSENPTHPQGFGQHTSAMDGSHLGKRIAFRDLPTSCQEVAKHFLED